MNAKTPGIDTETDLMWINERMHALDLCCEYILRAVEDCLVLDSLAKLTAKCMVVCERDRQKAVWEDWRMRIEAGESLVLLLLSDVEDR